MCGLLNTYGGSVYIGIDDKDMITGINKCLERWDGNIEDKKDKFTLWFHEHAEKYFKNKSVSSNYYLTWIYIKELNKTVLRIDVNPYLYDQNEWVCIYEPGFSVSKIVKNPEQYTYVRKERKTVKLSEPNEFEKHKTTIIKKINSDT